MSINADEAYQKRLFRDEYGNILGGFEVETKGNLSDARSRVELDVDLQHIRSLEIGVCTIGNRDLSWIAQLSSLEELCFNACDFAASEESLETLPSVKSLCFLRCCGNIDLLKLCTCGVRLKELVVIESELVALNGIENFPVLEILRVVVRPGSPPLALSAIARAQSLRHLDLRGPMYDATCIARLPHLESAYLPDGAATYWQGAYLVVALPECNISFSSPEAGLRELFLFPFRVVASLRGQFRDPPYCAVVQRRMEREIERKSSRNC